MKINDDQYHEIIRAIRSISQVPRMSQQLAAVDLSDTAATVRAIERKLDTMITTRCTCKTCRDDPRIDRVARALCSAFDTQDAPVQDMLKTQARKAIAAMEETK